MDVAKIEKIGAVTAKSTAKTSKLQSKITRPKTDTQPNPKDTVEVNQPGTDIQPLKPKAKWLFLNYVAADCNLTKYQLTNLDQQEKVGSDPNTHLVAYVDVGNKPLPKPFVGDWQNCRGYYLTKDNTPNEIKSEMFEDFGRVDMSSPETLKRFTIDAMKRFPSEHVAVILNDHGAGFAGAMADESDGSGIMSTPDIAKALKAAVKETGKKIDIIGFDACLMAETEVAYELKGAGDFLLASEETEGAAGWNYTTILGGNRLPEAINQAQKLMDRKIDVGPRELARLVVDVCSKNQYSVPTFSAVDLNKIDTLKDTVNEFAESIINTNEKDLVKSSILKAENYAGGYLTPYKDIRDLNHIAKNIGKVTSDPELKETSDRIQEVLGEVVLENESNQRTHPESKGLSIYAPNTKRFGYNYDNLAFVKDTKWGDALKSLANQTTPTPPRPKRYPNGTEIKY